MGGEDKGRGGEGRKEREERRGEGRGSSGIKPNGGLRTAMFLNKFKH